MAGAFAQARETLGALPAQFASLVDFTVTELVQDSFVAVDDFLNFANASVNQANSILDGTQVVINQTEANFEQIHQLFTVLQQYQSEGYISGVPDNSSVPNATSLTGVVGQAQDAIQNIMSQLGNLTDELSQAKTQINTSSPTLQQAFATLNDTISVILSQIDSIQSTYDSYDFSKYTDSSSSAAAYTSYANAARLPVILILLIMPMVLSGLWFVGKAAGRPNLMLIGFWYAAAVAVLFMLVAGLHVALFIVVKDGCVHRDHLIQMAADYSLGSNVSDYAVQIGVTGPAAAIDAVNNAMSLAISNPSLLLDCKADQSLITQLNIDVPTISGIRGVLANASNEFLAKARVINITGTIEDAQPQLHAMYDQVLSIYSNISSFNDTLANYTGIYNYFKDTFDPSSFWNESSIEKARTRLADVNSVTNPAPYYLYYGYDNISSLYPYQFAYDQWQRLADDQSALQGLIQLNKTVIDLELQLSIWGNITANLTLILINASGLVETSQSLIWDVWLRVNDSASLPDDVAQSMSWSLGSAMDEALQIASMTDLGRCDFIGSFGRKGWRAALCFETGASAGVVALFMLFICCLWLVGWPIVLSTWDRWSSTSYKASNSFEMSTL